jgi:uncharacterized protein
MMRLPGWLSAALCAAVLWSSPAFGQGRAPFTIAGRAVPAGTRVDIDIPVAAGASDPATFVPVTVFHGASDGPVLALTAGVHGFEYPPIVAAQQLLGRIDPRSLSGTVILVRIAHVSAFEQRVPYVNPYDRKNLNRVFPGRADGTQTERIAWTLTTEVIRRCDLHVELHSGDGAEWLEAFAGIYGGTLAEAQYARSREMGLAFGFPNVQRYAMDTQAQVDSGRSLNRQAVADGKPTVLIEIGENGRQDPEFVDAILGGIDNLLRVLKMLPWHPTADPARYAVLRRDRRGLGHRDGHLHPGGHGRPLRPQGRPHRHGHRLRGRGAGADCLPGRWLRHVRPGGTLGARGGNRGDHRAAGAQPTVAFRSSRPREACHLGRAP